MQETTATAQNRKRIHSMDEIRGFAVLCMIFYHGFYTAAYLLGYDWGLLLLRFFMPAEPVFAGLFIFISGISSNLSHSNLIRGAKLLAVALVVTLATVIVVPQEAIWFGILHFLSICMILCGLVKPFCDRQRFSWIPPVLCAALYAVTMSVPSGSLFFGLIPLPNACYQFAWLAPLGFPSASFASSDYFPLIPWIFIFFAGFFVGRLAADGKFPAWLYKSRIPPLSWMGRHALILYILHQPVIYGLGLLIQTLTGQG